MSKKALVVVSFGTTYPDARRAIEQLENTLRAAFPDHDFFRAFTSGMVIRKIAREEGVTIPTPEELMELLRRVTPERIRTAAQSCRLDTVFFLKGKEEEGVC